MTTQVNSSELEGFRAKLDARTDLTAEESARLFDLMRSERDTEVLASILRSWMEKGYTSVEIASCAGILRREVKHVKSLHEIFIDVVGTGGSRRKTFNISTAAAFVAAGAGLPVAKHGNRAASSRTGSADVLSELGVSLSAKAALASKCLNKHGICFMFAPHFHNLTKEIAEARKKVGLPTIFNLLGPVANPAGAPFQLIGIWEGEKAEAYGDAVSRLGTKRTWIVHGSDGLDEITLSGPTRVTEVTDLGIDRFEISPSDFGLKEASIDNLRSRTAEESADIVLKVLNSCDDGPARKLVAMNAGTALFIAGHAESLKEGFYMAEESIDSGVALDKLRNLSEETSR
ncbi:MAG TPA: anthranilate phosphoribosyltransferase [Aridibacter sp.]|nr:anthranilate phosphoribosyltransferase [Aridibacter sp.]